MTCIIHFSSWQSKHFAKVELNFLFFIPTYHFQIPSKISTLLLCLTYLLEIFSLLYTFVKFKLFIYFKASLSSWYTGSIYITSFKFLPFFCTFLTSRNFYFFPPILLIPGSIKCLFIREDGKEVESTFFGRVQFSKLIFPVN